MQEKPRVGRPRTVNFIVAPVRTYEERMEARKQRHERRLRESQEYARYERLAMEYRNLPRHPLGTLQHFLTVNNLERLRFLRTLRRLNT